MMDLDTEDKEDTSTERWLLLSDEEKNLLLTIEMGGYTMPTSAEGWDDVRELVRCLLSCPRQSDTYSSSFFATRSLPFPEPPKSRLTLRPSNGPSCQGISRGCRPRDRLIARSR